MPQTGDDQCGVTNRQRCGVEQTTRPLSTHSAASSDTFETANSTLDARFANHPYQRPDRGRRGSAALDPLVELATVASLPSSSDLSYPRNLSTTAPQAASDLDAGSTGLPSLDMAVDAPMAPPTRKTQEELHSTARRPVSSSLLPAPKSGILKTSSNYVSSMTTSLVRHTTSRRVESSTERPAFGFQTQLLERQMEEAMVPAHLQEPCLSGPNVESLPGEVGKELDCVKNCWLPPSPSLPRDSVGGSPTCGTVDSPVAAQRAVGHVAGHVRECGAASPILSPPNEAVLSFAAVGFPQPPEPVAPASHLTLLETPARRHRSAPASNSNSPTSLLSSTDHLAELEKQWNLLESTTSNPRSDKFDLRPLNLAQFWKETAEKKGLVVPAVTPTEKENDIAGHSPEESNSADREISDEAPAWEACKYHHDTTDDELVPSSRSLSHPDAGRRFSETVLRRLRPGETTSAPPVTRPRHPEDSRQRRCIMRFFKQNRVNERDFPRSMPRVGSRDLHQREETFSQSRLLKDSDPYESDVEGSDWTPEGPNVTKSGVRTSKPDCGGRLLSCKSHLHVLPLDSNDQVHVVDGSRGGHGSPKSHRPPQEQLEPYAQPQPTTDCASEKSPDLRGAAGGIASHMPLKTSNWRKCTVNFSNFSKFPLVLHSTRVVGRHTQFLPLSRFVPPKREEIACKLSKCLLSGRVDHWVVVYGIENYPVKIVVFGYSRRVVKQLHYVNALLRISEKLPPQIGQVSAALLCEYDANTPSRHIPFWEELKRPNQHELIKGNVKFTVNLSTRFKRLGRLHVNVMVQAQYL